MTSLVLVEQGPTLTDLAESANREHAAVLRAGVSMLEHALLAGDALIRAREIVPSGEWMRWVDENCKLGQGHTAFYIRLATYREQVLRNVRSDASLKDVAAYLRGMPRVIDVRSRRSEGERAEALRLHSQGVPQREIARLLGLSFSTINNWVNPKAKAAEHARYKAKRRRSRKLEQQAQRDEAARRHGGSAADAYSFVRKAAQALDRAVAEIEDREARLALNKALVKLHNAEDEIVRALGVL